jgi:hypothetical protein
MLWNGIILMPIRIQMLLSNPMPIQIDQDQAYHFCVIRIRKDLRFQVTKWSTLLFGTDPDRNGVLEETPRS